MQLNSTDTLTNLLHEKQIFTWEKLVSFVGALPYGRNTNRSDCSLVLKELKGSCSSKHAFLKTIADLNQLENVKLILCIYKMSIDNTPQISNALDKFPMKYIPEAHCFLQIENQYLDYTSIHSSVRSIEKDILEMTEIQPKQVSTFKVTYHKNYLKSWIITHNIPLTFEEVWNVREACINNLATT